ncbi:MAG: ATP-binding protein [Phycisphaerales bacterium]|nr:ATP-binding protein [Phycisphaerales bacterium]
MNLVRSGPTTIAKWTPIHSGVPLLCLMISRLCDAMNKLLPQENMMSEVEQPTRSPWEWTEEDLHRLVRSKTPESIELDYKQSDALRNTTANKKSLSKDVSAFANSAGGTLVYGIRESKDSELGAPVPESLDNGLHPDECNAEWIEQVINSTIQRRITGVRINPIKLTNTRLAYVVYVPQSTIAPHQACDKKFYKRFNFESVAMEEYEIRDVTNRPLGPILRARWYFHGYKKTDRCSIETANNRKLLSLQLSLTNSSAVPATHIIAKLFIDHHLEPFDVPPELRFGLGNFNFSQGGFHARVCVVEWVSPPRMPVFDEIGIDLVATPMRFQVGPMHRKLFLASQLRAPFMTLRENAVRIDIEDTHADITQL